MERAEYWLDHGIGIVPEKHDTAGQCDDSTEDCNGRRDPSLFDAGLQHGQSGK
jgi:hypothetical protein